jgi:hypothetical protein
MERPAPTARVGRLPPLSVAILAVTRLTRPALYGHDRWLFVTLGTAAGFY